MFASQTSWQDVTLYLGGGLLALGLVYILSKFKLWEGFWTVVFIAALAYSCSS